ncbi:N-formylglutamate amidohydrolase [uncultured Jannaschia sp.]|uniref:N-formylglutamate amidohydrolase n=1 Tax=uncultured Jannaschia sp. TaxID=293347 RepID=UPI002628904E|nr:N-formylglutamate amidohydrolase [uncultured Jannaschia sp.]
MPDQHPILGPGEPPPFASENEDGTSPFVIVCEHAGRRIPDSLGTLGLDDAHLARHFMWDIGALDLARAIARRLDAPLAWQRYSRMICDCNRHWEAESFIPAHGEGIPVPANAAATEADRNQRRAEIWQPFQGGVEALLDRRVARGRQTLFVTIHSFTPVFYGEQRSLEYGILYDRNDTLSPTLLDVLRARHGDKALGNEPYSMSRENDYTVPVHGEDRGLDSVEIEVRNNLLATAEQVEARADDLASALIEAAAMLNAATGMSPRGAIS